MTASDSVWWVIGFFIFFSALSIAAIIIKNKASKSDNVGHSEKDTIATNVSIEPKKNTKKIQ